MGSRWFGIRMEVPLRNIPFHKGIQGIQSEPPGPKAENEPLQ